MTKTDRSLLSLATAALVVGLLVASFFAPWYTYRFSSGPKAPPVEDFEGDANTTRERIDFYPYRTQGDETSDPNATLAAVQTLGHLGVASLLLLVLFVAADLPLPRAFPARTVALWLSLASALAIMAALLWAWLRLWPLVADRGVDERFSTVMRPDGYVQGAMGWGFALAGLAFLLVPAMAAFKFQAGATSAAPLEEYARTTEAPR